MAKNLTDLLQDAIDLNWRIKVFLQSATYDQHDDLSGLDINYKDPEDLFLQDELRGIAGSLDDAYRAIAYLRLPVESTSILHQRPDGRFETEDGYYYTSGDPIEALIEDDWKDAPYWVSSRVEGDENGYYIVGHKDVSLNGLQVRRRKKL